MSHHPPISCWWAEGAAGAYEFSGEMEMRSKFWGKSVEMLTSGQCWLKLKVTNWSPHNPHLRQPIPPPFSYRDVSTGPRLCQTHHRL